MVERVLHNEHGEMLMLFSGPLRQSFWPFEGPQEVGGMELVQGIKVLQVQRSEVGDQ